MSLELTRELSVLTVIRIGLLLASLWLPSLHAAPEKLPAGLEIGICDDQAEWPPFIYFERASGKKGKQIVGYSVDVISRILNEAKISYSVQLLPWSRCVAELKLGKRFQLTLNVSHNPERARDFLFSRPYYRLHSYYFYSKHTFPDGLALASAQALKRYRLCGVAGFNYVPYGLTPDDLDTSARSLLQLPPKLHRDRCDVFVEKLEVMAGYTSLGQDILADFSLGYAPLPGIEPSPFHMMVSRQWPYASALIELLDAGINQLESKGELTRFKQRYRLSQ
ncbi:polar amino acid transport system substrate-binding protein [Chitinivorax tropicus]|uniref:Polar amino acid transport system substrate-binding protein n=1 Tax=Chitinivorax tropicus TaxID=714531 RepID=A0A840MSD3_9PROT|nr:polar amino acid transport system substrate-binding protein [Chitinivorax tropicus]